ncbi:MAG: GH3 auxin-responsive promoter family protein [Termitinemataceae bacterium]|nr:MAG: GH3 auxin-responsive promoter family protein [Termitinemataceae bacterium]
MKEPKTKGWWKIKAGLWLVGTIGIAELNRESKNAKRSQEKTLRGILEPAKNTVYGLEHHFAEILEAKTTEEFYARYEKYVHINDYEDLKPYIERHKHGEADVLFTGKPKMYATTSGTTAEPKWIPVTERYYQDAYKQMNQIWYHAMTVSKPHVWDGPTLTIVGKAVEGAAPDGTLYGSISGVMRRDIPKFMYPVHTSPAEVFEIKDYKARYYALMRMGIERDTHNLVTANPSTLIEMQSNANEFYDEYVEDIERGTISNKVDIPENIRVEMLKMIKPNPVRAQELRDLKTKYGNVLPKHYWPNLQIVNCWLCGNTNVYYQKIKDSFPKNCVFHEFSYVSSECKSGVVLESNTKETILFGHKVFFEFIHESELTSSNPRIYQLDEIKLGERYNILVTTSSGLYRYNMSDLVEVNGFYNQFPKISFVQKVNGIVSLTGEKLAERQFINAVKETEQETGKELRFFVGFADLDKSTYRFYYEFANQNTSVEEAKSLTNIIDKKLMKFNAEYGDKRSSDRVKNPITHLLIEDSFEKFKARCIDLGYRDGQFKLNLLMQDEKRRKMFQDLEKKVS